MRNLRSSATVGMAALAVMLGAMDLAAAPAAPKAPAPTTPAEAAAAEAEGPQAGDEAPAAGPEGAKAAAEAPEPAKAPAEPEAAKVEAAPAERADVAAVLKPEPAQLVQAEPSAGPPVPSGQPGAASVHSPGAPPERDRAEPSKAPGEFPFAALLTYQPVFNTHSGYDLFDDDNVNQFWGLAASYDLAQVADQTALFVDLGWAIGNLEQNVPEAFQSTELVMHEVAAAVGAHYRVLPMVGPHARLAVGIWRWNVDLQGDAPGERFEDDGIAPFVRLGAGVSAEHTLGARTALGLLAEGGYTLTSGARVELNPVGPGDTVTTDTAELGTLELSGAYLRFAGLVRF